MIEYAFYGWMFNTIFYAGLSLKLYLDLREMREKYRILEMRMPESMELTANDSE